MKRLHNGHKPGNRKPEPEFYLMACSRNNLKPHEAIFLDDIGMYVTVQTNSAHHSIFKFQHTQKFEVGETTRHGHHQSVTQLQVISVC